MANCNDRFPKEVKPEIGPAVFDFESFRYFVRVLGIIIFNLTLASSVLKSLKRGDEDLNILYSIILVGGGITVTILLLKKHGKKVTSFLLLFLPFLLIGMICFYGYYFGASLDPEKWMRRAIEMGDSRRVRRILVFNKFSEYEIVASLFMAIDHDDKEAVRYLIEYGDADPNYWDEYGAVSPYLKAENQEMKDLLAELGANRIDFDE